MMDTDIIKNNQSCSIELFGGALTIANDVQLPCIHHDNLRPINSYGRLRNLKQQITV